MQLQTDVIVLSKRYSFYQSRRWALACVLVAAVGCGSGADSDDARTIDAAVGGVDGATSTPDLPGVIVGTWNLHDFSIYGTSEFRIGDLADKIEEIGADVLAVQELKVKDGSGGSGEQAWDAMLAQTAYEGIHNPWDTFDSTVGIVYNPATTEIVSSELIFPNDRQPFPREPLHATVRVTKDGKVVTFDVIVLHLKAFGDSVDRRRQACAKLDTYIRGLENEVIVIGDLNDDPYDPPASNSFTGTFLDAEPDYYFVTRELPPESVTSTGWFHTVGGVQITGEFLDHAIVTGGLHDRYTTVRPEILDQVPAQFDWWGYTYSDHFPLVLHFEP